ncbi:sensor histidine kinase [Actinomadura namibiensis]|uniref:histidine kinase n=1 Tax=Actinomadura namibiensis TaxID=182080 RepID=A0A7W3QMQ3_ACTNM|nr:sensor histidine kinase [Actinomadura namibiensis]MBA8952795.1 signal transduction histidine kinase [Actinomadura namibiensis]
MATVLWTRGARDTVIAVALLGGALAMAAAWPWTRPLDAAGALLLAGVYLPLALRRRRPGAVLAVTIMAALGFHVLQYQHHAAVPGEVAALFNYAVLGRRPRAVLVGAMALLAAGAAACAALLGGRAAIEQIAMMEAVIAAVLVVQAWRMHRARMAAILERAERAERDRAEEARRLVVEERLRIARDLHDLLAHSITVVGVQAGAAAHRVAGDRPVDRAELAATLNAIAATCRDARRELRATLRLLRGDDAPAPLAPPPGLADVADLAGAARAAGLVVDLADRLTGRAGPQPAPEVGVVAYRIVQEALTNVIKHAGARRVRIGLARDGDALAVTVADDGRGPGPGTTEGYGLVGMAERARSVGGAVRTGPGPNGGFTVTAVLPLEPGTTDGGAPAVTRTRPGASRSLTVGSGSLGDRGGEHVGEC